MWSADGVTSQEAANNEEERSLIERNTERSGSRLQQTTDTVMQVNKCKNKAKKLHL